MIKKIKDNFVNLKTESKILVYLFSTIRIVPLIRGIFVNIFVYKVTSNIETVIWFNIIYNLFLSWSVIFFNFIAQKYKINLKKILNIPHFFFLLSTVIIFSNQSFEYAVASIFLSSIWLWAFRAWFQPYHFDRIDKKEKQFYSWMLASFNAFIGIATPFISALILFLVPENIIDPYLIVLLLWPISYLSTFFLTKNLPDYTVKIDKNKKFTFKKLFSNWKFYWYSYLMLTAVKQVEQMVLYVTWFTILKTWANLWFYETVVWIISIIATMFLWLKQTDENIKKIIWYLALAIFGIHIFLAFNLNLTWYIIFWLISIILKPLFHATTISTTMNIMNRFKEDFNSQTALMVREIILLIWRVSLLFLLYLFIKNNPNSTSMLKESIVLISLFPILVWISLSIYEKKYNKSN